MGPIVYFKKLDLLQVMMEVLLLIGALIERHFLEGRIAKGLRIEEFYLLLFLFGLIYQCNFKKIPLKDVPF